MLNYNIDEVYQKLYLWLLKSFINNIYYIKWFSRKKSFGVLKAVKKSGDPAKDRGDTGPTVINAYWREKTSKEL